MPDTGIKTREEGTLTLEEMVVRKDYQMPGPAAAAAHVVAAERHVPSRSSSTDTAATEGDLSDTEDFESPKATPLRTRAVIEALSAAAAVGMPRVSDWIAGYCAQRSRWGGEPLRNGDVHPDTVASHQESCHSLVRVLYGDQRPEIEAATAIHDVCEMLVGDMPVDRVNKAREDLVGVALRNIAIPNIKQVANALCSMVRSQNKNWQDFINSDIGKILDQATQEQIRERMYIYNMLTAEDTFRDPISEIKELQDRIGQNVVYEIVINAIEELILATSNLQDLNSLCAFLKGLQLVETPFAKLFDKIQSTFVFLTENRSASVLRKLQITTDPIFLYGYFLKCYRVIEDEDKNKLKPFIAALCIRLNDIITRDAPELVGRSNPSGFCEGVPTMSKLCEQLLRNDLGITDISRFMASKEYIDANTQLNSFLQTMEQPSKSPEEQSRGYGAILGRFLPNSLTLPGRIELVSAQAPFIELEGFLKNPQSTDLDFARLARDNSTSSAKSRELGQELDVRIVGMISLVETRTKELQTGVKVSQIIQPGARTPSDLTMKFTAAFTARAGASESISLAVGT